MKRPASRSALSGPEARAAFAAFRQSGSQPCAVGARYRLSRLDTLQPFLPPVLWVATACDPQGLERSRDLLQRSHRAQCQPPRPASQRQEPAIASGRKMQGGRGVHNPPYQLHSEDLSGSQASHERQGYHQLRAERCSGRPEAASCPRHRVTNGAQGQSRLQCRRQRHAYPSAPAGRAGDIAVEEIRTEQIESERKVVDSLGLGKKAN
jgi:hypothetical protein